MQERDRFARQLLEESKFALEQANAADSDTKADFFLHSSVLLVFAALEAHLNSIAADFEDEPKLSVWERSIFFEKEVRLKNGQYELQDATKFYRLHERIEFIYRCFNKKPIDKNSSAWTRFREGQELRNSITHPREEASVSVESAGRVIEAILELLDQLYRTVYKRPYPPMTLGLHSKI